MSGGRGSDHHGSLQGGELLDEPRRRSRRPSDPTARTGSGRRDALLVQEEVPDEGSDAHDRAGQKIIRSIEHGVVKFLLTESPDDRPRLKLLEALQALKSAAPRRRYWPDLAVARMQQTLRSGPLDGASDPSSAHHTSPTTSRAG